MRILIIQNYSGHIIDRFAPFKKYINGKKFWHLIGSIMVALSFAFIFIKPPGYDPIENKWSNSELLQYYIPFIFIFQIAWATTQISHLSLTGDLSNSDNDRVFLNSLRNAFTVIASVIIHVTAMFSMEIERELDSSLNSNQTVVSIIEHDAEHVHSFENLDHNFNTSILHEELNQVIRVNETEIKLEFGNETSQLSHPSSTSSNHIDWADRTIFVYLVIEVIIIGLISTLIFQLTVKVNDVTEIESSEKKEKQSWREWFKKWNFYTMIILYCIVRLTVNITATYLPFYLQGTCLSNYKIPSSNGWFQFD